MSARHSVTAEANTRFHIPKKMLLKPILYFALLLTFNLNQIVYSTSNTAVNQTESSQLEHSVEGWRVSLRNQIKVHNPFREGNPSLKFSLSGVIVQDIDSLNASLWAIKLNDNSVAEFTVVENAESANNETSEFQFVWRGGQQNVDREVCFHYGFNAAKWYSTYQAYLPEWPMNLSKSVPKQEFNYILVQNRLDHHEFFNILEHLFFTSDGFAILLDQYAPWFIRRDPSSTSKDPVMCFSVNNTTPYTEGITHDPSFLDIKIRLFASKNIRSVTDYVVHQSGHIPKPSSIPDEWMFQQPSWFTTRHMEQQCLVEYGKEIAAHGFGKSELVVYGNWEEHRGDFHFNSARFPNVSSMMENLIEKQGFRLTLSISPHLNSAFNRTRKYMLKNTDQLEEVVDTNLVDFSNREAGQWYNHNLRKLYYELGVDSFLIVAPARFEYNFRSNEPLVQRYPNLYITRYLEAISKHSSPQNKVTSTLAFKSQHLPVFYQLFNFEIATHQSLKSLIPSVLAASIGGYSFLVPSVLNHNDHNEQLYIRWIQAISLMPRMQFHTPPWNYTMKCSEMAVKFVHLHRQYEQVLIDLAKRRVSDGTPIIRPMWYIAPDDARSYAIYDQYMVGDDIVVAPVVELDQTERQVYLPSDDWIDQHGAVLTGPGLFKVRAPLEELPFFKRAIYK